MIVPLAIRSLDHAPSQPRHATTPRKHLAADLGQEVVLLGDREPLAQHPNMADIGVVMYIGGTAKQVDVEVVADEEAAKDWIGFGLVGGLGDSLAVDHPTRGTADGDQLHV